MALHEVPIIDIAPFLAGSADAKRRVAAEVDSACEEIGFLIVKGHGVPRDLVEEMYDFSKRFFALPLFVSKIAANKCLSRDQSCVGGKNHVWQVTLRGNQLDLASE